jgi:hypothetical protein
LSEYQLIIVQKLQKVTTLSESEHLSDNEISLFGSKTSRKFDETNLIIIAEYDF